VPAFWRWRTIACLIVVEALGELRLLVSDTLLAGIVDLGFGRFLIKEVGELAIGIRPY